MQQVGSASLYADDKALVVIHSETHANTTEYPIRFRIRVTKKCLVSKIFHNKYKQLSHLDKSWISNLISPSKQKRKFMFAFQGNVDQISILLLDDKPQCYTQRTDINLFTKWITGFHSPTYKATVQISTTPYGTTQFVKKGNHYFVKIFNKQLSKLKYISRNQAFQYCQNISGHLPKFFSRDYEEEFISFLKTSSDLFVISAMFIDLKTKNDTLR